MTVNTLRRSGPVATIIVVAAIFSPARRSHGAEKPPPAPPELPSVVAELVAPVPSQRIAPLMDTATLKGDAGLQSLVSVRVKSSHLEDVLADLGNQSGVKLTLAPSLAARQLKLTARVQSLTIGVVMDYIGRLYSAGWRGTAPREYELLDSSRSEFDRALLRLGAWQWYHYGPALSIHSRIVATHDKRLDLGIGIIRVADEDALRSAAGVLVTALPPDLQQQVRDEMWESHARAMVRSVEAAESILPAISGAILDISSYNVPVRHVPADGPAAQRQRAGYKVIVRSATGESLAELGFLRPPPGFDRIQEHIEALEAGRKDPK